MLRGGFLVWLMLMAAAAAAQPSPPAESARQHFDEGTNAFNLGEFTRAVEEYKAAYKLRPDPVFLYNIAQSYRLANDLQNALFFYRSYLHSTPDATNRREVEGRIETLDKQLAQQKLLVTTPPNTTAAPSTPPSENPPPPNGTEHLGEPQVTARPTPLHKKWWLWAAVGGGVAAVALGVGLGVGLQPKLPDSHFGSTTVF